jgi:cell fate (sporulation/competence/biofilm development) regulator YlbF (YheA/YmcA/DUF963 family)
MDRQAIIDKAWETVDEIRQSAPYLNYLSSLKKMDEDPGLCILIADFCRQKDAYEALKAYGTHHPDLPAASAKLAKAKDALFSRPEYQEYLYCQKELNEQLHSIGKAIQAVLDDCAVAKKHGCQGR